MDLESENAIQENYAQAREEIQKLRKRVQTYKDTMTLIKIKMNKADVLIRQYNDKLKECDSLSEDVSTIKNEKQDLLKKYNLTMEKMAKLELANIKYKQSFEQYKDIADKQKIKLDENEKHIDQLIFKIQNAEEQNLSLEDKIKSMEYEVKSAKIALKSFEKKFNAALKEQASQTNSPEKRDVSIITEPIKIPPNKLKMQHKSTMTDQCIDIKKEPFPIFCTKCEMVITPSPVEQILKVMSLSPPFLSEQLSPPNSPKLFKPIPEIIKPLESSPNSLQNSNKELLDLSHTENFQNTKQSTEESKHFAFMELDKLTRKMNKLEKLIKKKSKTKQKQNNCFHKNCCSSKNIKFILQLPNEEKFFQFRKRKNRKVKQLFYRYNNDITVKEGLQKNEWLIEDFSKKAKKRKVISNVEGKLPGKKMRYNNDNKMDLFESSEVVIPDVTYDYFNEDICKSKERSKSPFSDSLSIHTSHNEIIDVNLSDNEKLSTEDVNMDESVRKSGNVFCSFETSQASVSENIYETSIERENVQKENFVVDKVNANISYSDSLPISVEDNKASMSIVAITNTKIEYDNLAVEATDCKHVINESIIAKNDDTSITDKINTDGIFSNEFSKSNIIPSTSDELTRDKNIENQGRERDRKLVSYEKSERSGLNKEGELPVSETELEKFSYNSHVQENTWIFPESNKLLDNVNESTEKNVTGEDCNLSNKKIILNPSSNTEQSSIDANIIEDIFDKKCERKENSTRENNIASSESSDTMTRSEYKSYNKDTDETNTQKIRSTPEKMISTEEMDTSSVPMKNMENDSFIEEPNNSVNIGRNIPLKNNEILSDLSIERCTTSILKDKKCSDVSDVNSGEESSEEKNTKLPNTRACNNSNENCNKFLPGGNRKKLLTKIKNIRKNSKKMTIANKLETHQSPDKRKLDDSNLSKEPKNNLDTSIELSSDSRLLLETAPILAVVPKKQRIAHTPKSINIVKNSKSDEQPVKKIEKTKSVPKCQKKDIDKVSSIIEEINKTFKDKVKKVCSSSNVETTLPLKTCTDTNYIASDRESNQKLLESKPNASTDNVEEKNNPDAVDTEILNNVFPSQIVLRKHIKKKISAKSEDFNEDNAMSVESERLETVNETKQPEEEANGIENGNSPVRTLRSRHININNDCPVQKKSKSRKPRPKLITWSNASLSNTTVVSVLNECLQNPKEINKFHKEKINLCQYKETEKCTMEQLKILVETEQWTTELNCKIMENILVLGDLRSVANFVIEFTAERIKRDDEVFDRSHTPPAPIMTRSEQKLVTLILEIDKKHPTFVDIVSQGVQFKLFRLNSSNQVQIVERLFRILVVLNKLKKDREKVRIFCCDALYCLNVRAINIIYVALTSWPEILPKYDSNNDILVKTIVHIIMTLQLETPSVKLNSLRKLLFTYYDYPNSGYTPNGIKTELLKKLHENSPGVQSAILLICKKMGSKWALDNIVKDLKQIIVAQSHPSIYEILILLGNILRSIPIKSKYKQIFEIMDQLCDVLDTNIGSKDVQEGIASCLISISKFNFERVARCLLKWKFDEELRPPLRNKLNMFFKCHDAKWWWNLIKNDFPPSKCY